MTSPGYSLRMSLTVKKLFFDFDIFSLWIVMKPLCSQYCAKLRLRNLVLVMREDEVAAATVEVELLAEVLE